MKTAFFDFIKRVVDDVDKKGEIICWGRTAGSDPPGRIFASISLFLRTLIFLHLLLARAYASVPTSGGFSTECSVKTRPIYVFGPRKG